MSRTQLHPALDRIGRLLLGAGVTCVTVPTVIGPAVGGWLASTGLRRHRWRSVASGFAGVLGAGPWAILAFLALQGAVDPIGYNVGAVTVGLATAAPDAVALWQEIGVSLVLLTTTTGGAVAGGVVGIVVRAPADYDGNNLDSRA